MLHSKHLLKTTGTEMVSEMFLYLAEENMIKVPYAGQTRKYHKVSIENTLLSQLERTNLTPLASYGKRCSGLRNVAAPAWDLGIILPSPIFGSTFFFVISFRVAEPSFLSGA